MGNRAQRHPWWFGLVSAVLVVGPAFAISVWRGWALSEVGPTLAFTFLLWFIGRAILMRRSQRTESR